MKRLSFNKYDYMAFLMIFALGGLVSGLYEFIWWKHLIIGIAIAFIWYAGYKSSKEDRR